MEIKDYRKRKEAGQIEYRPLGAGRVAVYLANYHPGTGEKLPDASEEINLEGLQSDRKQLETQIDAAKGVLADLDALIADVKAQDESFGKPAKK